MKFEVKDNYNFEDFVALVSLLRGPGGCPWDAEQTHESIRNNVLEEAYEVAGAIDSGDMENLREELGDLLMQVLFHAEMEREHGGFSLDDICDTACKKLVFRHPHVFSDYSAGDAAEARLAWEELKRREKRQKTHSESLAAVAETLPALWRAEKIQKRCASAGFEWPEACYAVRKITEETEELNAALEAGDQDNAEEELGDLLFAAVNAGRFAGVDPEHALHRTCEKVIRRYTRMEELAAEVGENLAEMPLSEQEKLYQEARWQLEGKKKQFLLDNSEII